MSPDRPPVRHLSQLFEESADAWPEAIAAEMDAVRVSYGELDRRANQLAHVLRSMGVGADVVVGICMDRSVEMLVAVLAVLKAGGAYLPLDPRYPAARLAFMLSDARPAVLLTEAAHAAALPRIDGRVLCLDVDRAAIDAASTARVAPRPAERGDRLTYVIYTSGSTGQPKGVAMVERALLNLIEWQVATSDATVGTKTLQFSPLSFDVSFQEILSTWASGGALVLVAEAVRLDGARLLALIERANVTRLFLPFVALQHLAEVATLRGPLPRSLREVITAGEQLRVTPQVRALFERLPGCRLHNHYGPSETHVVTAYALPASPADWSALPPIGRPLPKTTLHLLDGEGRPVAKGEPGELFIGGVMLARGYLNRPDLTAERFVPEPGAADAAARCFKTGDLARFDGDGNLEFLGRRDDQVKIRGHRIELGEVEAVLGTHPDLAQVAVAAPADASGQRRLVAYVVARRKLDVSVDGRPSNGSNGVAVSPSPGGVGPSELRRFMAERLPDYLVPSVFVALEALPLTPSGKVDRRALPAVEAHRPELEQPFVPPTPGTEATIAEVWRGVLGIDRVGALDHFFDLGGTSLLALRSLALLQDALGRDVPVLELFARPTVRALAALLDGAPGVSEGDALAALVRARARRPGGASSPEYGADGAAIAIIGMAGRFPGAPDLATFWQNLRAGVDSITELAPEEIDPRIAEANEPGYVRARGILAEADKFDAAFFSENPRVADVMDPQQRVFLEVAWAAFEDAGVIPGRTSARVGVFAGVGNNTYQAMNVQTRPDVIGQVGAFAVMLANEKDYVATRLAHKLNLKGTALSIHTACSTSLVAVAEAVRKLLDHDCDVAIAGGASITVPQNSGHLAAEGAMLSPDGRTRAFSARGQGTVFSDGAGAVVLKRLAQARADGDRVYAVIRGVATNNDGAEKASFTAPSAAGQAEVVAFAHAMAGVSPESIGYVEAHGTATPIGDPIEIEGLTRAFRLGTNRRQVCAIGSVKTNFGHLTAAAGVAGLIKTALALHHGELPPSLYFDEPNPNIDFAASPFYVNTSLRPFPSVAGHPRRAGVSSFGVGGTNAHVVLEEAPVVAPSTAPRAPGRTHETLVLSAKSAVALDAATRNLATHLAAHPELSLEDVAFTLHERRATFSHRRFVVAANVTEAADALATLPPRASGGRVADRARPGLAFLFPGQGAQYPNMARTLYERELIVRRAMDDCFASLGAFGAELRQVMFVEGPVGEAQAQDLAQTKFTQPALFVVENALARLWLARGLRPRAMVGHSVGEFVAAHLAGVLSLEDALRLVTARGRLVQALPSGGMLSVRAAASAVEPRLRGAVSLAASNGPTLCVVAGPHDELARVQRELEADGIACKALHTSHAFHSAMVEPAVAPFRELCAGVRFAEPQLPFVSTVTGTWITPADATNPDYWARHLRAPVRFAEAVQTLWKEPDLVLLEVGPHTTLTTLAKQGAADVGRQIAIASLEGAPEAEGLALARAVGQLWLAGVTLDPGAYFARHGRHVTLPTYAFERQRHWVDPAPTGARPVLIPETSQQPQAPAVTAAQAPDANVDPHAALIERLRGILEESSGVDLAQASPRATFLELGLDSLFLTQAALTLQRKLGVPFTFRQLLEELSSLEALAAYVEARAPQPAAPVVRPPAAQQVAAAPPSPASEAPVAPAAPAPARAFGPQTKIDLTPRGGLTKAQEARLGAFVERYVGRTPRSKAFTAEHRARLADPRVVSGWKPQLKEITYPIVVDRSRGMRLVDLDGYEYVDLTCGFGADFFGHSPPFIVAAIKDQLDRGMEIGPMHPLAGEVAQLITEFTGHERVAFCNTGSEAVLGATRVARTVTGRNLIATFEGDYHGIFDEVIVRGGKGLRSLPAAAGIPGSHVENMLVLEYGSPASMEIIKARADELAAVMVEPVQSRRPDLQPAAFLRELRDVTTRSGSAYIFDEVITGFRIAPGGAQEHFGVKADLGTYGKIIGGGMPLGALAGCRRFMDALDGGAWSFGDDSFPAIGVTYFAGTFIRHPPALAAARAALLHLRQEGPELQRRLNARTDAFCAELNQHFDEVGAAVHLKHFGSVFKPWYDEAQPWGGLIFHHLRLRGVHVWEGRPCFLTLGHTEADIQHVIKAFKETVAELQEGEFLTTTPEARVRAATRPPVPGARLGKDPSGKPAWFVPDPSRPGKYLRVDA